MATEKSVLAVIRASRPTFRNNHDKLAFALHASFLAAGYSLSATGPPAFSDSAISSASTEEVGIDNWNELEDQYAFVYVNHEKGSKKFLVKCLAMNDKLLVDALADGAKEPVHLEIEIPEFVGEEGGGNYAAQFKNLDKFVSRVDAEVLSKLDGSALKASTSSAHSSSGTSDGSSRDINDAGIRNTEPMGPQIHPSGVVVPPIIPFGGNDTYPGPGAGVYPTRGGLGSGGSMLVGPDDPRWFEGFGHPGFPGGQPGVPPGARFDPFGPPGVPGFEPGRFVRRPRRPGGDTHPDLEHFRNDSDFI